MGLAPRDIPVTREQVHTWLQNWTRAKNLPNFNQSWESFLKARIDELKLPDTMVSTVGHEDLENETPLLEMILRDMDSYG